MWQRKACFVCHQMLTGDWYSSIYCIHNIHGCWKIQYLITIMNPVGHSKLYGLCATPLHDIQVCVLSKIVEVKVHFSNLSLDLRIRDRILDIIKLYLYSSLIIYQFLPLISKSSTDWLLNRQDINTRQTIVELYINILLNKDFEPMDARNNIIFKS